MIGYNSKLGSQFFVKPFHAKVTLVQYFLQWCKKMTEKHWKSLN